MMFTNLKRSDTTRSRGSGSILEAPLREASNANISTASSSFLPELNSTPPLPTFQRDTSQVTTDPPPPRRQPRPESMNLPEIADAGYLITPRSRLIPVVGSCGIEDRPADTPRLPKAWSATHDRAICALDRRGYYHAEVTSKLKQFFPELKGALSVGMIDKRLRQLDQIPEIDYFKPMAHEKAKEALLSPRSQAIPRKHASRELPELPTENCSPSGERKSKTSASRTPMEEKETFEADGAADSSFAPNTMLVDTQRFHAGYR